MVETAEQYKARFRGYVEGKDPIAMQREAPRTLAEVSSSDLSEFHPWPGNICPEADALARGSLAGFSLRDSSATAGRLSRRGPSAFQMDRPPDDEYAHADPVSGFDPGSSCLVFCRGGDVLKSGFGLCPRPAKPTLPSIPAGDCMLSPTNLK